MAEQTVITDDLGGTGDAQRIEFAFKGVHYEIDLNAENLDDFEHEMQQWIEAGRVKQRRSPKRRGDAAAIRVWAAEQGIELSDRGRIPNDVVQAYETGHGPSNPDE